MNLQEIQKIKQQGDTKRIAQIANKIAKETGLKTYSETTVRQMLNGNRKIKPVVEQAATKYYELVQSNKSVNV